MDSLFVLKGRLQEFYAQYGRIIDRAGRFALALATFYMINRQVGFMAAAATPAVMLALAVICAFLPATMTVMLATALVLLHMYAVSLAALAVTALVFLVLYIFYFRLTPKMAVPVLLTPIAFACKVPYILPVACGLLSSPIAAGAVTCGIIVYYMMLYVKKASAGMKGSDAAGFPEQMSAYVKQVFQNKEMWIIIVAFIICVLFVFTIRKWPIPHAWKVAAVVGAVVNVVVISAGDVAMGVTTDYTPLFVGNVAAIVAGLILELLYFAVDYTRGENFQYEDDEYYYYVKAIPKLSVATPEKTVKRINERQETEIIDPAQVRKKAAGNPKKPSEREVEDMLLSQSMKNDPDFR